MEGFLIVAAFVSLFVLGFPVVLAIGIPCIGYIFLKGLPIDLIAQRTLYALDSFPLVAVPVFLFVGSLMNSAGISRYIYKFADTATGRLPGGLAQVNIFGSLIFAGMSGSALADIGGLGRIEIDAMKSKGFSAKFAAAVTSSSAIVGPIFPPSIPLIIYGTVTGVSVIQLLLGGILPGMLLSVAFVAWIIVRVRISPHLAPADTEAEQHHGWARWQPLFAYVLPTLSIFGVVVGALAAGWATPTECAALGAFATMFLAALYRVLRWEAVLKALKGTASISGMILFIILGATTFAQILSFSGASSGLVQFITGHGLSANQILVGMLLMLIFLGIFVDQVSMMMITLPIFMPIVNSLGIDSVWFGVLFLICMQLGLLLPPHGLLLMTMRGVAPPSVTMGHIFLAVTPYVVMSLLLLTAVFFVPGIATWLPGWMG